MKTTEETLFDDAKTVCKDFKKEVDKLYERYEKLEHSCGEDTSELIERLKYISRNVLYDIII